MIKKERYGMAAKESHDKNPVQANSYTCAITRMTREARALESVVRERKRMRERETGEKKSSTKGERKTNERQKRTEGRHIEGAERRTINVRTTTSRWPNDQTDRPLWTKSSSRHSMIRECQKFRLPKQRHRVTSYE